MSCVALGHYLNLLSVLWLGLDVLVLLAHPADTKSYLLTVYLLTVLRNGGDPMTNASNQVSREVPQLEVPHDVPTAHKDVSALLEVKKGSVFFPLLVLILMSIVFTVIWLPSGGDVLADRFAMACKNLRSSVEQGKPTTGRTLTPLAKKCANPGGSSISDIKAEFLTKNMVTDNELQSFTSEEVGGTKGVAIVVAAAMKDYLDNLFIGVRDNFTGGLGLTAIAALLALAPGLIGLIYRRAFWFWYLLSFGAILLAKFVSSSALQLTGMQSKDNMSSAATVIFIVVLGQLLVLLLVNRLQRHSVKRSAFASMIPPKIYNVLLAVILVIAGLGMWYLGWGDNVWGYVFPGNSWLAKWNFILLGLPFIYAMFKANPAWTGTARKNIVICLDGTSNTPTMTERGLVSQTNVFKLFKMMKVGKEGVTAPRGRFDATLCKTYGDKQIALYYSGIGNEYDNDPFLGGIGLATGLGATSIIERAYLDVMRVWRPGDRVFITGFSRGAASARILARAIDARGAPSSIWTLRLFGRHWTLWPSKHKAPMPIDVLGCWDTVGSFGVGKTIAGINFQQSNLLHDMTVPDNVKKAYHMVALDEERQEFEPTLMQPDPFTPERIVEVWFPGTHAGVGGGFATDRLSDLALEFLLEKISSGYCKDGSSEPGDESWGIYLTAYNGENAAAAAKATANMIVINPDPRGQIRGSISGIFNYRPRKPPLHAVIHESVFERMKGLEPVYAPQALFDLNDALDARRDKIAAKIAKFGETKSLEEAERQAILDYTDKLRLTRWVPYWRSIEDKRNPEPLTLTLENA